MWWLLWLGCAHHASGPQDPGDAAIAAADAAWARRDVDGFDPVVAALTDGWQAEPTNAGVLWRFARVNVAKGLAEADPHQRLEDDAMARQLGMACLEAAPSMQGRTMAEWKDGLDGLVGGDLPCAAWTADAWARWIADMGGDAAAIDAAPERQLLDRAVALDHDAPSPEPTGEDPGLLHWANGVFLAVIPEQDGGSVDGARRELLAAIAASPDDLSRRADLVELVAVPTGDASLRDEQTTAIHARTARWPEDKGALVRIGALPVER